MTSAPASPGLTFGEDLTRFPTESLHSFSFAHQSEEAIHNRQSILKRSIDFMRDKIGWAASNPGLVAAQARLSGDASVQSMLELLARSNLIGEDANAAHGLGMLGPLSGPAEMSGENVFEKSFNLPMSQSPELVQEPDDPQLQSDHSKSHPDSGEANGAETARLESVASAGSPSRSTQEEPSERSVAPTRARIALKRTYTNIDELAVKTKLIDTLAQPYTVAADSPQSLLSPANLLHHPPAALPSVPGTQSHLGQHAAPHGHGNRWAPAAQAIFTTEGTAPWTITAANDLACLVFGVTKAEVRKLGILEVVREERRRWLEEKLRDPNAGSIKGKNGYAPSPRATPNATTTLNVGRGITAKLLSKPSSRKVAEDRRSRTEDGSGGMYSKSKVNPHHVPRRSRGVLLCGDVVPIQKRNGAFGSASLWVKEKKGGLIWVLEEIAEDVAYVNVDDIGCVTTAHGAVEAMWGTERVRAGMDIQRLIPALPRRKGTNTGALDYPEIAKLKTFTSRIAGTINIPVTVEQVSTEPSFRVSSFPHIAGIMVVDSRTLRIHSSNPVFSSALFGCECPEGMHVTDILPGFDKVMDLMTDEDNIVLVEGIVIPEHSFRRARALLAMREGKASAAAVFNKPSGLPARHRDGSEIMVDVQMRVVKSERATAAVDEQAIEEVDETQTDGQIPSPADVVYALWITYSRQLHATIPGIATDTPLVSRPATPPHQPSPGQPPSMAQPDDVDSGSSGRGKELFSSLTKQLLEKISSAPAALDGSSSPPAAEEAEQQHKKTIADFVVLEDMGQGAYGQVKLCRYKKNSQKKVVIKYVTKRRILVDTWTRDRRLGTVPLEIHVLDYLRRDGLKHPNIVEMSDFFEDDINYYIEMVPHGLPGMDLFDYIELRVNMDEAECRKIFVQVVNAVWHLHIKARVVHRDIKDENVILDGEGNIKLIDFGSAAYIKNGPFDVFVGTIGKDFIRNHKRKRLTK